MDFRIDEFDVFEKGDIMETIRNVDVNRLHDFKNHPFKVEMNTELCELMRSIEKEGVLVPLLVRNNPYGERWNQTVDRAMISGVAEEEIMGVKHEKISEEVKRFIELYGNNPSFLAGIIRLAIKALELLISKILLAAAKIAERVVNVVHEKVVEKEVPVLTEEPTQAVVVQEEIQFPTKPKEPLLLSKYPMIMELDVELKRKNEEIFTVEQERGKLEIELSECTGVFKQKQRKELQERITFLDKKVEKMKTELSNVLRDAGYVNAAEFFTELFTVCEEKRKYEEACKKWQEEHVMAKIGSTKESQYFGDVRSLERGRTR